jgi:hypothetical protein
MAQMADDQFRDVVPNKETGYSHKGNYEGAVQGRPDKGWSAQTYGYGSDSILVKSYDFTYQAELESMGLQRYDSFTEKDGETYLVYAPAPEIPTTTEEDTARTAWWRVDEHAKNWAHDLQNVDWGAYVPGVDILEDTLDTIGQTAQVEVKGNMIKVTFSLGMAQTVKYYEFPNTKELQMFLERLSNDCGIDIYTGQGAY